VGDKTVSAERVFQNKFKDEIDKVNRFYLQQLDEISAYIKKLELRINHIVNRYTYTYTGSTQSDYLVLFF
jgi:hypothetical protein